MKLLFDQNLSPRLVERLTDIFPDSTHVYLKGQKYTMLWTILPALGVKKI